MRAYNLIHILEQMPRNTIVCLHGSEKNCCRDITEVQLLPDCGVAYVAADCLDRTEGMHVWKDERRTDTKTESERLRGALLSIVTNLTIHIKCGRAVAPGDHVSFPILEAQAYIDEALSALGTHKEDSAK